VAGLSVGTFAAAVMARALGFEAALRLVELRGRLMDQTCPEGHGMAAVIGLDERAMAALVVEAAARSSPVYLAGVNASRQVVIAGADAGIATALELARAAGAHRAERLRVRVPSHCPLMEPVADALERALVSVDVRTPQVALVGNRRARVLRDPGAIREELATNVTQPVRWHDATTLLHERGVRLFVELPPGRVLTDLAIAAFPEARAVALEEVGLDSAVSLVRRIKPQGASGT
jgi:malonate decarboxylase epsilon subunit